MKGGVSFPFSFQFLLGLAAVFAEEVGGFVSRKSDMFVTHFAGTVPDAFQSKGRAAFG